MILKRYSWHSWIYRNTYNTEFLPGNLCAYFWKLVLALLLVIPAWPGYVLALLVVRSKEQTTLSAAKNGLAIQLFFLMIGICITHKGENITWLIYLESVGILLLGFAIIVLLATWIGHLSESGFFKRKRRPKKYKPYKESILKAYWKAFKGKYCPVINWEVNDTQE